MKRVLLVAYHFPPLAGSSGIQRTLRFVRHLPRFGWEPLVLSAMPFAYEQTSDDLEGEVPAGTVVRRAVALDAARHLALRGRYIAGWARPDRWASWRFDGVRQGLSMVREFRPQAIWSTYPIATAHVIGAELQARTGLPWVADFRDPMAQDGYPADPLTWRRFQQIEETALRRAACSVFTSANAARSYRARYPFAADRITVLENGYDEEAFAAAEARLDGQRAPLYEGAVTLLHSGIVYPSERDPTQLFEALGQLARAGLLSADRFRLRFRAPVHTQLIEQLAQQHGVAPLIDVAPPIPYREALQEMLRADALLVMQAANCNEQIPAKVYEYLRARRPLLCLSHADGDTWRVLREAGLSSVAPLDDAAAIAAALPDFVARVRDGTAGRPAEAAVAAASREGRTRALAARLDALAA